MNEKKYYDYFEKYYSDIPDCVCTGVEGYNQVLSDIFDLTNGLLTLNHFEGINDADRKYKLNLIINDANYTYEFIGSDYFEQDLLVKFNEIIEKKFPNEKRRLIEFGDGIDFDFAIAFFEKEKEYELAKSGKIWRSEDWIFNYEQKTNK